MYVWVVAAVHGAEASRYSWSMPILGSTDSLRVERILSSHDSYLGLCTFLESQGVNFAALNSLGVSRRGENVSGQRC